MHMGSAEGQKPEKILGSWLRLRIYPGQNEN